MKICVYSASSGQVPEKFIEAATQLGRQMAKRNHCLINGAGRTGLMGATTDATIAAGGKAVGVIPKFMVERGWQHTKMTKLVITPDMHQRKETMAEMSDACIALPGGIGTLEELLEIITWKQLGLYTKPIVILNIDGYFNPLLKMLTLAIEQKFMRPEHQHLWCVATTPDKALSLCETTELWDSSFDKFATT